MPRDARAYVADILESCEAIRTAAAGLDLEPYQENRLVRSSIEREFIIIGEAMASLRRIAPEAFAEITSAHRIVDFRNQLTHEYPNIDDAQVWAIIGRDVPVLARESAELLSRLGG
ncbi:MAG: DUF86 domain-containing protein [Thermoleophilia bacterium]|jgi:uncharacterized protein with HEPN domain|nr:DUF86 domain-containing protein [Thermoleophilia bacterium]